jgi:hypothetical protein
MPLIMSGPTHSPANQRRSQNLRDDHGRAWHASIDKKSGGICGLIQHLFTAPDPRLVPPQKYLSLDPDNSNLLHIDYDQWIRDLQEAETGHQAEILRLKFYTNNPIEIAMMAGPGPTPVKPVLAMKQGNLWALGLSDVRPPEADTYFPPPAAAGEDLAFSGPVFTEPKPADQRPSVTPAAAMGSALSEIEARCPPDVKGTARSAWIMAEIKKLVAEPQGV